MVNNYRKAVIAFLTAFVAYAQGTNPATLADWGKCALAGLGTGIITWYVPNGSKSDQPTNPG